MAAKCPLGRYRKGFPFESDFGKGFQWVRLEKENSKYKSMGK